MSKSTSKFIYTVIMDGYTSIAVEADYFEHDEDDKSYNFWRQDDGDVVALIPVCHVVALLRSDAK